MQNDPHFEPSEEPATICSRLKQLRVHVCGERGQSHFAGLLHLSPSTYNYYEKGRVPPVDVLDRASRVTRAPLLWLIRGEPHDFDLSSVPRLDTGPERTDAPRTAPPGHTQEAKREHANGSGLPQHHPAAEHLSR